MVISLKYCGQLICKFMDYFCCCNLFEVLSCDFYFRSVFDYIYFLKMSVLEHSTTNGRLKLKKISSNIHFPEDKTSNLPYLGKEITACTTILTSDCEQEIERRVEDELTSSNSINWCRTIHNVYPLKVTGNYYYFCVNSYSLK